MCILNSEEGRFAERQNVSKVTLEGVGSIVSAHRAAKSPRA